MKWNQMLAVAALATAGTLSACAQTPPRPKPRHNPNPIQRYQITMTIADAPGPFASIDGSAYYDTVNYNACGVRNESTGTFHDLEHDTPVTFTKVSATKYVATVYMDLMQDEDYHGRGACRWKFSGVGIALKATGAAAEARFVPYISADDMIDGRAVTTYFNKSSYPGEPDFEDFPVPGETRRSRFGPRITDDDLFTITLAPKAVTP